SGQEDPRDIIKKSITAVGGADRIDRFKGLTSSAKGTSELFGVTADFTARTVIGLPDRLKMVAKYQVLGNAVTLEQRAVGDKMTFTLNGAAVPITEAIKADLKAAFVRTDIVRLTPLLADKQYTLKALGRSKADGKEYVGVAVSGRGVNNIKLYFDRSTSLLSH